MGHKSKVKKTERTQRAWGDHEEHILMKELKDLVRRGWKNENGFRPGYQLKLEDILMTKLPGTDIRANPHINFKTTMWKKAYGSIRAMLTDGSGVSFNTTNHLIHCSDEAWEKVVKNDPLVANMRHKTWPLYDDWVEVFGDDLPTTVDVSNTYNDLVNDDNLRQLAENAAKESENTADEAQLNLETNGISDMDVKSQTPDVEIPTEERPHKKRAPPNSNTNGDLVDVVKKFVKSFDERLDSFVCAIGYEADLGKARKEVFSMLSCVPDLTLDEKLDVSHMLAKNTECLEMFMGLPADARARYTHRLLSGDFWLSS